VEHPGLVHAGQDLAGEQLVANAAFEALHPGWAMGCRARCTRRPIRPTPVADRRGGVPQAVVAADEPWCTALAVCLVVEAHHGVCGGGPPQRATDALSVNSSVMAQGCDRPPVDRGAEMKVIAQPWQTVKPYSLAGSRRNITRWSSGAQTSKSWPAPSPAR
jgi:hypothetical protein